MKYLKKSFATMLFIMALIFSICGPVEAGTKTTTIYVISNADRKQVDGGEDPHDIISYSYSQDGKIKKRKEKSLIYGQTVTWKYKYKGDKLLSYRFYADRRLYKSYKYDDSGRVATEKEFLKLNYITSYSYDKHHMIKRVKTKGEKEKKYTNTYKNGKLVKAKSNGKYYVQVKYKYKKINVPKKEAAIVKAQQRWIYFNEQNIPVGGLGTIYKNKEGNDLLQDDDGVDF